MWLCHYPIVQQCPCDQAPHVLPVCLRSRAVLVAARRRALANLPMRACVHTNRQPAQCATQGTPQPWPAPSLAASPHPLYRASHFTNLVGAAAYALTRATLRLARWRRGRAAQRVFMALTALLSWMPRCAPCNPPGLTRLLGRAPRPAPLRLLVLGRPGRTRVRAALQVPPLHLRAASPALGTLLAPSLPTPRREFSSCTVEDVVECSTRNPSGRLPW